MSRTSKPQSGDRQTPEQKPPLRADRSQIDRALAVLFEQEDVVELRIPKTERDGVMSGYFNDREKLPRAAADCNGSANVYATLNPVRPDLLARAANRIQRRARVTTSDKDIVRRRWLPIDCDPARPADISSTDEEHEAALERARDIRMMLAEEGWPAPILADSGNGAHLLYPIDLPNDAAATALVAGVLEGLAKRFDDTRVKIDPTMSNAARIIKVYGTVASKGDNTPPAVEDHRRAERDHTRLPRTAGGISQRRRACFAVSTTTAAR
jgi:hypothetical protein